MVLGRDVGRQLLGLTDGPVERLAFTHLGVGTGQGLVPTHLGQRAGRGGVTVGDVEEPQGRLVATLPAGDVTELDLGVRDHLGIAELDTDLVCLVKVVGGRGQVEAIEG